MPGKTPFCDMLDFGDGGKSHCEGDMNGRVWTHGKGSSSSWSPWLQVELEGRSYRNQQADSGQQFDLDTVGWMLQNKRYAVGLEELQAEANSRGIFSLAALNSAIVP